MYKYKYATLLLKREKTDHLFSMAEHLIFPLFHTGYWSKSVEDRNSWYEVLEGKINVIINLKFSNVWRFLRQLKRRTTECECTFNLLRVTTICSPPVCCLKNCEGFLRATTRAEACANHEIKIKNEEKKGTCGCGLLVFCLRKVIVIYQSKRFNSNQQFRSFYALKNIPCFHARSYTVFLKWVLREPLSQNVALGSV